MRSLGMILAGLCFILLLSSLALGQQFTPGNIAVYRVGDGSGALAATTAPVFVDEYTTAGVFVQTFTIATSDLTNSGSATSEGRVKRSFDGRYLTFAGYLGGTGATTVTATAASFNRVVGRMAYDGTYDATTKLTDCYNTSNIRCAWTQDGSAFWTSGNGGSGQGASAGVRYATLGATTTTALQSTNTNTRVVAIYNSQLYYTAASSPNFGVVALGTGVPTSGTNTPTILNGFPIATGPSPYDFEMSADGDTIYVADDRAVASGGGLQKWTQSAGLWSLAYTLSSGLASGLRGLMVDWSGVNAVIYAVDASSPSVLVSVTDAGSSSAFTTLATAATNTAFRGVAWAPLSAPLPVEMTSFIASASHLTAQLRWYTATEVNNFGFEVERKCENTGWSKIGFVAGAGTSTSLHAYTFSDNVEQAGLYEYRIKQIDKTGGFKYSQSTQVEVGLVAKVLSLGSNYPNPFNPMTNIEFSVPTDGRVVLKIYNMLGQEVATLFDGEATAGRLMKATFDASRLSSGIYFSRMEYNRQSLVKRMTLMK